MRPSSIDNDSSVLGQETELKGENRYDLIAKPARHAERIEVVLSIPEAAQPDLMKHRTVLQSVDMPHGPIKVVGPGFRLEHGGASVERPPATLGQHTDEILR